MAFYDLGKEERSELVKKIYREIEEDLRKSQSSRILKYFSDEDTYIRKAGYQAIGKIYKNESSLTQAIISRLEELMQSHTARVRQTTVNAAGEIGMFNFDIVRKFFETGLFDDHHSVRNAVIGSIKKMSQKNPAPTLQWAKKYLHHADKEIRREICHGIELRGRTHPQDILPLLQELQHDSTARVRNTLIHVLGQIAYKKGCLPTVIESLNEWENKELVGKALDEIVDVHQRYNRFAALSQKEAIEYIDRHYSH